MRRWLPPAVALAGAAVIGVLVGFGVADYGTVLMVLVFMVGVVAWSAFLATGRDRWLWWVVPVAYLAKLAAAGARFVIADRLYEGAGDFFRYHNNGQQLAEVWRSFQVPPMGGGSGAGTVFVDNLTGLIYAIHQPTLLGGFFIFGTLAFAGQVLFYCAFRHALPEARLGIYAALVLFLPGLVFWPSSIGKESLMVFFLGIATYGLTRSFAEYEVGWLLMAGFGLAGAGLIRPHVALILSAGFALSALFGRGRWLGMAGLRRMVVLAVGAGLVVVGLSALGERYDLESTADLDPFVSEVQRRTQTGGSAVEGGAVASPADMPAAALRVLFRPLPNEAHNLQALAAAWENALVLGFVLWRIPAMVRNRRLLRHPYLIMSAVFVVVYTLAFSTIFNLGILTRQRAQVLPYLLAVVVGLGWRAAGSSPPAPEFAVPVGSRA